jgi:hypothetical protein
MRSNITCAESFMTWWRPAWLIVSPHLHNAMAEPNRSHCPGLQTFASICRGFCDYHVMSGLPRFFTPLLAGLGVTLVQLAMAVCLLAPEEPVTERYSALIQHDSYWFMNIIDRGYQTIVPPIDHKVMEISNVAFFPAYPAIAALLQRVFYIGTDTALLITAQLAAWGFWTYFFLFCRRWKLPQALRFCGALLILANPAAFFLVSAYSESLFLMALLGFLYWSTAEGPTAKALAAIHGMVMSAARIVGIVCAAFPVVRSVFRTGWRGLLKPLSWIRENRGAIGLTFIAASGAVPFFAYCQLRWGHWDLYMLTQASGWGIVPDYLAMFRPENYRWLVPALNNPTEASQLSMTLGAVLLGLVGFCEMIPAIRRRAGMPVRVGIYFCAAVIYYLSVSGVASVEMESMLRYAFGAYALIVLAFLNFLGQFRTSPVWVRALGTAAVALISAAGLCLQGWYVWNFTRGNWVA